jgi:hypothetical protein
VGVHLPPSTRRAFDRLAQDFTRVFDQRLVAVVASGPASSVVFVDDILGGDLDALGALAETWQRDKLDTPLLLTVSEFRRSLDAFPVEYQGLVDHHLVIVGTPPFADLAIEPEHLRRACETAAKGYLVYLRQSWIEAAGHDEHLAALIASSAERLRTVLTQVARLQGVEGTEDRVRAGALAAGLDAALVADVLAVERTPARAARLVPRLPDLMSMADALWVFVDEWAR